MFSTYYLRKDRIMQEPIYKIEDVVEMGHLPGIGGSVKVSLEFNDIISPELEEKYLNIIDTLDHCIVTDKDVLIKHTDRYFLLDESKGVFKDVHTIMYNLIEKDIICTVSLGKASYTNNLKTYSKLLEYNHEG